jgi:hypothetical protein
LGREREQSPELGVWRGLRVEYEGANSGRAVKRAVYRTVWDGRGTDKHRLQHRSQHRAAEPDPRQTEGETRVLPPLLPVLAHLR